MFLWYRCKENCGEKQRLSSRIVIGAQCHKNCVTKFGSLSYSWELFSEANDTSIDLDNIALTGRWTEVTYKCALTGMAYITIMTMA